MASPIAARHCADDNRPEHRPRPRAADQPRPRDAHRPDPGPGEEGNKARTALPRPALADPRLAAGHDGHEGDEVVRAELAKIKGRRQTFGMRHNWYIGIRAMMTIFRVLPDDLYEKVLAGETSPTVPASPARAPTRASEKTRNGSAEPLPSLPGIRIKPRGKSQEHSVSQHVSRPRDHGNRRDLTAPAGPHVRVIHVLCLSRVDRDVEVAERVRALRLAETVGDEEPRDQHLGMRRSSSARMYSDWTSNQSRCATSTSGQVARRRR